MEPRPYTRRGKDRPPLTTALLLMCILVPTLTLLQQSESQKKCQNEEYLSENGICCNKCFPGYKLEEECRAPGERSTCTPCPAGQYMATINYADNCRKCRVCKKHDVMVTPCWSKQNTVCRCEDGYYRSHIDSETYNCVKCRPCELHEREIQKCTPEKNTVCECEDNYYRNNSKCEPCSNCTGECESRCSLAPMTTAGKESKSGCLYNMIGVATTALVLLLVVGLVTHVLTKRCTERKLQNSFPESPDLSSDPSEETLISKEKPLHEFNFNVTVLTPVSDCEPTNLPDCIPPEIKISELIYTLLDVVPVLQVKQLVRSLGVRDTEIEQVELDHRSCREAHYQMLRVWAEQGSRAGNVLHPPLLQQLLNELRRMHLGQAAEELENSFGFK